MATNGEASNDGRNTGPRSASPNEKLAAAARGAASASAVPYSQRRSDTMRRRRERRQSRVLPRWAAVLTWGLSAGLLLVACSLPFGVLLYYSGRTNDVERLGLSVLHLWAFSMDRGQHGLMALLLLQSLGLLLAIVGLIAACWKPNRLLMGIAFGLTLLLPLYLGLQGDGRYSEMHFGPVFYAMILLPIIGLAASLLPVRSEP